MPGECSQVINIKQIDGNMQVSKKKITEFSDIYNGKKIDMGTNIKHF